MKRWISLLLVAATVFSLVGCGKLPQIKEPENLMNGIQPSPVKDTDISENASALLDFYLDIGRASSGEGNMLVSPLSVLAALAMTANGAKGETLTQMENVLGVDVSSLNSWIHSYLKGLPQDKENSLKLANSIWFTNHKSFTPAESFLQTNADYYGAGIYQTPFDAATLTAINNWVAAHTDGMVKNILDRIPEDAVMYLVNALAFEAQWPTAYEEHQVRESIFTMADGTERTVSMMHGEEGAYLEDDRATGFIKYYKGGKYAFVALLPKEGIMPAAYLRDLTGEKLLSLLDNPQDIKVFSAIPKFEMAYSAEMSQVLKAMGMTDAFDAEKADFTGLGTSAIGKICISRVLHKTTITVAEQGTRAGAATMVEMRAEGATAVPEYKEVTLDRPFVYMLIDCENNMPFFIGTMEDPSQTENKAKEIVLLTEEILEAPPELTLRCGNAATNVRSGSYDWNHSISECDCSSVIACGAHPLQIEDYPTLQPKDSRIVLDFAAPAESWSVTCWSGKYHGQTDAQTMEVELTEDGFILNEGDCIYLVTAKWNTPFYSGTAEYTFRIEY